jgi:hypothetical protein
MRRHVFVFALASLALAAGCSAGNDKTGGGSLTGGTKDSGTGLDPEYDGGDGLDPNADGGGGGNLDPNADNDGDGYLYADDCNDKNPLMNPGAFDVPGDGADNDCDGTVDNPPPACDGTLAMTSTNAMDFAKALGLCQTTTAGATGKDKKWGVISAKLMTTDGKGTPMAKQYGIHPNWGSVIKPKEGGNLAVLSTGSARMPGQTGYMKPLNLSTDSTTNSNVPPAGWPKNTSGCDAPLDNKANDSVVLQLQIRVPTNAKAFSYDFDFYSSEYITYVCSAFNDSFVTILKSGAPLDASHAGNISFDSKGNPVNVNSGFFEVCTKGSKNGITYNCPLGTNELKGTGFEGDGAQDGATSWLRTTANVLPGETITVSFMIWNTSDHVLQWTILVDNFQWSAQETTAPVTDRPPA